MRPKINNAILVMLEEALESAEYKRVSDVAKLNQHQKLYFNTYIKSPLETAIEAIKGDEEANKTCKRIAYGNYN